MSGWFIKRRLYTPLAMAAIVFLAPYPAAHAQAEAQSTCGERTVTGEQLFEQYCALCHGITGTGNGPLADALKIVPTDLTELSKRAGGQFPSDRVIDILRYGGGYTGHGSRVMPVWSKLFRKECGPEYALWAVGELERYLKAIQKQ